MSTSIRPRLCPHAERSLGELLYLSRADVESTETTFREVRGAVHRALRERVGGRIESPPKRGVVPGPDCSIRAMKAYVPSLRAAGVKWIAAYPNNVARGLPTISGVIVLNDAETGLVRAVLDCTWITAMRTAACTSIAASYLALESSASVGIVACGLQGRMNLAALCAEFPVRRVRAFDIRPEAARGFAREMAMECEVEVEVVDDAAAAAREVDIVVTSAPIRKDPRPPIGPGCLEPGAFACLLDFDASFNGEAMREADKVVVDDLVQLGFFKQIGYCRSTPVPDAELPRIVAGRQIAREHSRQRVVCLNLGIGYLDVAVAALVYAKAVERGVGTRLRL